MTFSLEKYLEIKNNHQPHSAITNGSRLVLKRYTSINDYYFTSLLPGSSKKCFGFFFLPRELFSFSGKTNFKRIEK